MTYLEPLHVLPCFGGVQRISHRIELSPQSHYIIKTNKNEMIRSLEEENIIMNYRWHSHKHSYTDASGFTCMLIKTKRGKVERRRRKQKVKTNIKKITFYCLQKRWKKEGGYISVTLNISLSLLLT